MRLLAVALLLSTLTTAAAADETGPGDASAAFERLLDRALEAYLELDPVFATGIGDDRYNGRLTLDLLPAHRAARRALFDRTRDALAELPRGELPPERRDAYDAFALWLDLHSEALEHAQHLLPYWPGRSLPVRFARMGSGEGLHPFRTARDYDDFLGRMGDFERWVDAAVGNMRRGIELGVVQPRSLVEDGLAELRPHFEGPVEGSVFYRPIAALPAEIPEAERRRLETRYREAIAGRVAPAYRRLHDFLKGEYLPACRETLGFAALPGGARWYRHLVRFYTTTDLEPDEIFALGEREVERITAELDRLKRRMRFVGNLHAFHRRIEADPAHYLRGRQVLAGFDALSRRVTPQLGRLFHHRPAAGFDIRPVEAYRAATAPGAFYEAPSADGARPATFYVNLGGDAYPRWSMEVLFLHEALPGHHLQLALTREREDLPRFLRFAYFGAYVEGWGLYAEGLGEELGLYRDPLQVYGRLTYDLGRASRLIADVGIHHRGWSRKEAMRYLRRRNLSWSMRELDRYVAMPAQALTYKVGERTLLRLRRRAEEVLGKAFDPRDFHHQILGGGPLPLAVLEAKIERWLENERKGGSADGAAGGAQAPRRPAGSVALRPRSARRPQRRLSWLPA